MPARPRTATIRIGCTALFVVLVTVVFGPRLPAQGRRGGGPAAVPAPPASELASSVRDGFTMASVGDLIVAFPQSANPDPAFQGVLKILRDADVATGNYEGNIIDG